MRGKTIKWILAAVLCFLLAIPSAAAEVGSLRVKTKSEVSVTLYHVAEIDGTLTEEFSGADISKSSMTDSKDAVKNARTLLEYAHNNDIEGLTQETDLLGSVLFDGLKEGRYLVSCRQDHIFDPFLVSIPTVINGETLYRVKAEPKTSDPDPDDPTTPENPDKPEPDIPQTGESIWPKYLLMIFGVMMMTMGCVEMARGRKETHE